MAIQTPKSGDTEVIGFIHQYTADNGYPPSISEIANRFKLSRSGVHSRVTALVDRGLMRKQAGSARAVSITEQGMKLIRDPLTEL